MADTGDTAKNDSGDQRRRDETGHHVREPEIGLHRVSQGVGLDRVAGDERGKTKRDGEEDRHPFPPGAQAVFDVVHRAAGHGALMLVGLGADLAVLLGQRHL